LVEQTRPEGAAKHALYKMFLLCMCMLTQKLTLLQHGFMLPNVRYSITPFHSEFVLCNIAHYTYIHS